MAIPLEHRRAANEIPRIPIGQRDLAAGWRGVEDLHHAGLDDEQAVVLLALVEQRLAAIEHPAAAAIEHHVALRRLQAGEQIGRSRWGGAGFGEHEKARAGCRCRSRA